MRLSTKLICATALPLLAACSGGSDDVVRIIDQPSTTAGGTLQQQLGSTGLTGIVGRSDGRTIPYRVRRDESGSEPVYLVSFDGAPEEAFTIVKDGGDSLRLQNEDSDVLSLIFTESADFVSLFYQRDRDNFYAEGVSGLQTANLPGGTLEYSGFWNAYTSDTTEESLFVRTELTAEINFASGNVSGTGFSGSGSYRDDALASFENGPIEATLSGRMIGSEMVGAMEVSGFTNGTLGVVGAVFGPNAEGFGGGVAGQLTYDAKAFDVGGELNTTQVR